MSRPPNSPLADAGAVREALRLIVGDGVTELRALEATTIAGDRWPATYSGYFDDPDALVQAITTLHTAKGVYITPNPVNPALLARAHNRIRRPGKGESTSDGDIIARRWLLIDADPVRPAGISSTDAEHAAALERCQDIAAELERRGWSAPIVADSGNGGHLLYRIDLPADDSGLVARCLAALAGQFDDAAVKVDTKVGNAARIWKLYGTLTAKGDSLADRPHRVARILHAPAELCIVVPELLAALAEPPAVAPLANMATSVGGFDLERFIAQHLPHAQGPQPWSGNSGAGERWILNPCPWNPAHTNDSAFILRHASGAISAGCHHNGCAGRTWADLRGIFEPRAMKVAVMQPTPAPATAEAPAAPPVEPFAPFPSEVLPEPARSFVQASARAIGCDESFVALPLLAALASAIGNTRRIELKNGWAEPAIVWAAVVGDSGTLKTPAFKAAMKPARKAQAAAFKEYALAQAAWEADYLRYEAELLAWKRAAGSDKGQAGDPPEKPVAPIARRYIVSDTTIEALAPILLGNPRGVLLARDELAGWIGAFDRYAKTGRGGADAAHWLSMHNAEEVVIDRKTGIPPTIHVPSASVSIAGGIQPGILARVLGSEHRENGLAARLLLACPPRRPKRWTEAEVSPALERRLAVVFERLYSLQPTTDGNGDPAPVMMPLSSDGKAAWVSFYNAHGQEQAALTGDLSAVWSKLEGYAARLALVMHFVRWAATDPTLASADAIDADSIAAGVTLSRWFGAEAKRAYAILGEDDDERDQRRTVELLERRGGSITVRELQQTSHRFRTAGAAQDALNALAEAGLGRWEEVGPSAQGGRPTRVFRLNSPPASANTTPQSDPPAPTKPPMAGPESGCVGVGTADAENAEGTV